LRPVIGGDDKLGVPILVGVPLDDDDDLDNPLTDILRALGLRPVIGGDDKLGVPILVGVPLNDDDLDNPLNDILRALGLRPVNVGDDKLGVPILVGVPLDDDDLDNPALADILRALDLRPVIGGDEKLCVPILVLAVPLDFRLAIAGDSSTSCVLPRALRVELSSLIAKPARLISFPREIDDVFRELCTEEAPRDFVRNTVRLCLCFFLSSFFSSFGKRPLRPISLSSLTKPDGGRSNSVMLNDDAGGM
jgi:hypothetical protein